MREPVTLNRWLKSSFGKGVSENSQLLSDAGGGRVGSFIETSSRINSQALGNKMGKRVNRRLGGNSPGERHLGQAPKRCAFGMLKEGKTLSARKIGQWIQ